MIDRTISGSLTPILLLALLFPAISSASEPDQVERFQEEFVLKGQSPPFSLDVFRKIQERDQIWQVQVRRKDSTGKTLCHSTLPIEAGGEYYDFQLHQLAGPSEQAVLLLESLPTKEARRLDPPVYQIAFLLAPRPGERDLSCTVIARGEFTELDGGPALSFTEELPPRLLRHDAESARRFCGLQPDEKSDAERFDFQSGQFRSLASSQIDADQATKLQVILPKTPLTAPKIHNFYMWLAATSDHRGAPAGAALARPLALGDLDLTTAWISDDEDLGDPDFLTAAINDAAKLQGLRILPGHSKSADHFKHYARPKELLLSLEEGQRYLIELPDLSFDELRQSGGVYVELPEPIRTRCASLLIMSAHPGTSKAVAITEITPFSLLDGQSEAETAQRLIAAMADEPDRQRRDQIAELATDLSQPIIDAIGEVLNADDQTRRTRALPLLGGLTPAQALPVLKDHFLRIDPADQDYRLTKRLIAGFDTLATPTLFEVLDALDDGEPQKYLDITRLIGRVASPTELTGLIREFGQGDELLRRERIRAVAAADAPILPALLSAAASEDSDSPKRLDALSAIAIVGKYHFAKDGQALSGAEQLWTIYEQSERRAHRIRALQALGSLLHPKGDVLLRDQVLSADPDPVVRSVAATALRHYPGHISRQALEHALQDESPDVRIAAIETLYKRPDSDKATNAVVDYIAQERWPQGLSFAAQLLARSPEPEALTALLKLVKDDIESQTSATALRALRRNERSFALELIDELLIDDATPHRVQSQLVDMLTFSDDRRAEPTLIAVADGSHKLHAQLTPEQQDSLQRRALIALGARGGQGATDYLLSLIADPSAPQPHSEAALRGLSFASDLAVLQQLQDLAGAVPSKLRSQLRQTISTVRNRITLDDADREIEQRLQRLDQEKEETP